MADDFEHEGLSIRIFRSSRRRTAMIRVDTEGISMRVPQTLAEDKVRSLLTQKRKWIDQKLLVAEQQRKLMPGLELADGTQIPLLGQPRRLKTTVGLTDGVADDGTIIEVQVNNDRFTTNKIRRLLETWLRNRAKQEIDFAVNVYAQRLGLTPTAVEVKTYRARWGSCQPDGRVQFNWRLVHAPLPIIDYVVVHELCHLEQRNHGAEFWGLVEKWMPDYRDRKRWLKENSIRLQC